MLATLEIEHDDKAIEPPEDMTAPRTLQEAMEHWESQRRRNQLIRERYESNHGKDVLVRRTTIQSVWCV